MRAFCAGPVVAALLAFGLTACAYGSETITCPSWAGFPIPQEKYDAAELVVVASSIQRDGTARIFGVEAHSYQVQIDEVIKGDLPEGDVRISSMPDPCTGTAKYPGGDPLVTSERILIFANQQDGEWFTLTPRDGILPYSPETLSAIRQ